MMNSRLWHPLSTVNDADARTNMTRGRGAFLYDENGKAYLDGLCGLWNVSLGYGNQRIIDAVGEQMQKLPYINLCEYQNETVAQLAQALLSILHEDMRKIYLTCTGSESNELAIKIMHKYQALKGACEKTKIGVLESSYHGSYYGSLSASRFESSHKKGYGTFLPDFISFPLPFCRCCRQGQQSEDCAEAMLDDLEQRLLREKETLAGIIVEPVIGSGGIIPLPKKYLQRLAAFCSEQDILLACDEVATGFGRTGDMFAYEGYGIRPDIVCMSKGINSGYLPLGAVAFNKKIEQVFDESAESLFHLSTQNGNPLCCAASLATIEQLTENGGAVLTQVRDSARALRETLCALLDSHDQVHDIRNAGMMFAIDLVESKASGECLAPHRLVRLTERLKKHGLLCEYCYNEKVTSCIILFLPFLITQEEIGLLAKAVEKSMRGVL